MASTKITAPVKHKSCIIAPAERGFDVFDGTGHWFNAPTQRQARWWSSVYSNALDKFQSSPVRDTPEVKS